MPTSKHLQEPIRFGGGLNEVNKFTIDIEECPAGENFCVCHRRRDFRPRPPQDLVATTPSAAEITGILQLVKKDDTETTLVVSGDTVLEWDGSTTFTTVDTVVTGAKLRHVYWALDDFIAIPDVTKSEPLHKWNGTVWSRLGTNLVDATTTTTITPTAISSDALTATVTATAHGLSAKDMIIVSGADQTAYNIEAEVLSPDTDSFTYTLVTTATASPATGTIEILKAVAVKAKYAVTWSGRLWLFNVTLDGTDSPHIILASQFEAPENFDTATRNKASGITSSDPFFMTTPDGRAINGVSLFFDEIVFSTFDGKLFKITGTDATDLDVVDFYPGSAATGSEVMVNIGNDLMYMKKDGHIDRFLSTQKYGDVNADDVSRMIPNQVRNIRDGIAVYDQGEQHVYWFVTGKVLVLNKEMMLVSPLSPWAIWTTQMLNRFNTKAAVYIRRPGGLDNVTLWGDAQGRIFNFRGSNALGDKGDTKIISFRQTRNLLDTDIAEGASSAALHEMIEGSFTYLRTGAVQAKLEWEWDEELVTTVQTVGFKGADPVADANFWGGELYWGGSDNYWGEGAFLVDASVESKVDNAYFDTVGHGPGFTLKITVPNRGSFVLNRLWL